MANFFHARDVDETEQDVAAGRVVLVELVVTNPGNATAYVKLWDDVTANVDPSTDAATITFGVPAGQTIPIPLHGVQFVNGCCIGATTESGAGATPPNADLIVTLFTA